MGTICSAHLGLGLDPVLAPHIDAMPPDKHRLGAGVLQDGLPQAGSELTLPGGVFDDGDAAGVVVAVALNSLQGHCAHVPGLVPRLLRN